MQEKFEFLKAKIRGSGWTQNECIHYLKGKNEPQWVIDECLNNLKRDGYLKGKIRGSKSAPSVFEAMNQHMLDLQDEELKIKDIKFKMLSSIFEALELATELNDIDIINSLNNLLCDNLPYINNKQKEEYLDIVQSFTNWEGYKEITFAIMMNLYRK